MEEGKVKGKYFLISEHTYDGDTLNQLRKWLSEGAYITLGDQKEHPESNEQGLELVVIDIKKDKENVKLKGWEVKSAGTYGEDHPSNLMNKLNKAIREKRELIIYVKPIHESEGDFWTYELKDI